MLASFVVAGCGGALTVHGHVTRPAPVPVRAFPRILVVSADNTESRELANVVAHHLASGQSNVARLAPDGVRALRQRGELEVASVVVSLDAMVTRRSQAQWTEQEEIDCAAGACFESRQRTLQDMPLLYGQLLVTVTDGPSGRRLQRLRLHEEEEGEDVIAMRLRVLERLRGRARELFDQRRIDVAVPLYPVDHPRVQRAIARVGEGRWSEGRRMLEQVVASAEFDSLGAGQRALVLYDLGQTKRFDDSIPPERRFDEAERALQAAVRLSPHPLFARALDDLAEHRRNRAMVREQQEARAHNFALWRARQAGALAGSYRD